MIEKIANSWKLAKECWRILMLDKEMLAFPAFSMITILFVCGLMTYPFWPSGNVEQIDAIRIDMSQYLNLSTILKYLLFSFVQIFVVIVIMTFFNAGLVTCAFIRLSGGDPIVKDGLLIAMKRLPQILTWSVLSAGVGVVIRLAKGNNNILGKLLSGLLSLGWRVASFVAIPVIVAEGKGAIDALKRSGQLIKKSWGEALTLEVGFSVLAIPALIPTFILLGISSSFKDTLPNLAFALFIVAALYTFLALVLFSTLDAIAKAALYVHSSSNRKNVNFDNEILENIFKRESFKPTALA